MIHSTLPGYRPGFLEKKGEIRKFIKFSTFTKNISNYCPSENIIKLVGLSLPFCNPRIVMGFSLFPSTMVLAAVV